MMQRLFLSMVTPVVGLLILVPLQTELTAQQATNASTNPATTTAKKTIGFRLAEWTTSHYDDMEKADAAEKTLKRLGCEVERLQHNGHDDLRYRCPSWKQMTLETDELVAQWNKWLTERGMLTLVVDPAPDMKLSRVRFQLASQKNLHVHDQAEAEYTQRVLQMLGCEVNTSDHNGHIDLTFSCPEWKTIGCSNCPTAHGWQDWLKQQGFTTEHDH